MTAKRFFSNCLDDPKKAKTKLNRNYFFVTTVFFIALNLCIWALAGTALQSKFMPKENFQSWDDVLNFKAFFSAVINNLCHWDWNHVLLNMFPTFFVMGLYFERKYGSLKFFMLMWVMVLTSAAFVGCTHQSLNYAGFSCVNHSLFALFLVDFCFSFTKREWSKSNYILGNVMLIYVMCCLTWEMWLFDKAGSAADVIHNMGHYAGFLSGLIVGLVINFTKLFTKIDLPEPLPQTNPNALSKATVIIYWVCLALVVSMIIATVTICLVSAL